MPCSISFFMTGFTSSGSSTRSPMTIASLPAFWNARYEPSASGGLICTPSTVTVRSLRPIPTRYTPPGISVPARPIALATASQSLSAAATGSDKPAATTMLATPSTTRFMSLSFHEGIHDQPRNRRERDDCGLRNFLHLPKKQQRHRHDGDGWNVGDRALAEHDDGPGDGADRRRGAAVDESDDGGLLAVLAEIRRGNDGEQVARQERRQSRDHRARKTRHQVADEADGNDHRSRGDHRHRDRVDELSLREPVVLVHHAAIEERHDGEAAAEHESAGLGEEDADLGQDRPILRHADCARRRQMVTQRAETDQTGAAAFGRPSLRRCLDEPREHARGEKDPDDLGLGDDGERSGDDLHI